MRKVKITVAVPSVGDPKILYLGTDADAAIAAHKAAKGTIDGEVLYIRNPVAAKRWKGAKSVKAPAKKRTTKSLGS